VGKPLHAVLFAILPVLFLFAHNVDRLALGDLTRPLAVVAASGLLLYLLLRRLLGDRDKAGLTASLFWLWFFSWGHLRRPAGFFSEAVEDPGWGVKAGWVVLLAVALFALVRMRRKVPAGLPRLLNVVALVLVAFQLWAMYPTVARTLGKGYLRPEMDVALPRPAAGARLPNLYWIVLDGYARQDILARYGYDNRPFLGWLRRHGFQIADRASSNYYTTLLSFPCNLNMEYLDRLIAFEGPDSQAGDMPAIVYTEHNKVVRLLRGLGYRTVSFYAGHSWWEMTSADLFLNAPALSDFERAVLGISPLAALFHQDEFAEHRSRIRYTLNRLPQVARLPGPRFVFAHVLCPHPPFVFDEKGRPIVNNQPFLTAVATSGWLPRRVWERRYVNQTRYLNTLTERALSGLLAADPGAVVILQSDHGAPTGGWRADYREVLGILNAIRLPGYAKPMPRDLSPVNTYRYVFSQVFGARLPLLGNRHYFLNWTAPYRVEPVAPELVLPEKQLPATTAPQVPSDR